MPRVRVRDGEEDDKENIKEFQERLHAATNTPKKQLKRQPHIVVDTTLMDDGNEALHCTNTSFETLENMCEKTASDPNSTLFKYLHHGSPPSSSYQPTRNVRVPSYDEEADALQRLLDELNVEETEKRLKGIPIPTLADDTQLDDIEAPSRFWENTMTPETLKSISPVKMVGLMRQSTIMEEYSDVSESEASSTSYQSAMKTVFSSETSGCYDTANDTAANSERGAMLKKLSTNSSERSSSSELFQQRHSRQKFFSEEKEEDLEDEEDLENIEKSIHLMDFSLMKKNEEEDPLGESLQLIDLDTTVKSPQEDDDEIQQDSNSASLSSKLSEEEESYSLEPLKMSGELSTQITQSDESESLIIELSDDESSSAVAACTKKEEEDSESVMNRSFTIKSQEKPPQTDDEEKSLHFNDTMEEVEYMMNKGMQYLQAAKEETKDHHLSPMATKKSHLTPVKKFERYRSPSPMLSSPSTPKTVIAKPKPLNNKHVLNIKPFPKLDLFKKPQGSGLKPPNKYTSAIKKQQYAHVVSPIGAYIKKTPTTPLISTVRPDVAGVSVFRKLDCDSRAGMGSPKKQVQPQNQIRSLPKKAYVSSELKHIVDERTQYTIPGGPKIQKYLASAMIPAVVRHEGKIKIPANLRTSDMEAKAPRRTDDSLADLSLASGDMSVYTIRDAQKF
ncbi:muscle M-line assembly protein unc-89 isoform X2 [Episyrphus balteatus]|nr:muscle M-line assembly protein unc-89 isoform X2 [Episyrphus balteatus]